MEPLQYKRESAVPLNYEDLNRIENWTRFLAGMLSENGYDIFIKTKVWSMHSIPYQKEIDRMRRNIERLHLGYSMLPDWRQITYTNSLDFGQVNILEWDLMTIYTWLSRMVAAFCRLGEFHANEETNYMKSMDF